MASKPFAEVYKGGMFQNWDRIMDIRKPIIAAVNGYALGGFFLLKKIETFLSEI